MSVRVLVWTPPGVYRSILLQAIGAAADLIVLGVEPPQRALGAGSAAALRDAVARLAPDVVILPTQDAELRRLVGDLGDTSTVFVSADGRRALAYDRDLSADSLLRLIRSVTTCAHQP